jgi:hypothetical protein
MRPEELIGKRESETLEFKSAEILRKPQSIAREVVGMLNGSNKRCRIWIGVDEQNGITSAVSGVEDADAAHPKLRDHLIDTIEPRPSEDEVRVTVEQLEHGPRVLQVHVKSDPRHVPYAALNQGGRHYWRRVQDRLAPMTRDELERAWTNRASTRTRAYQPDAREWIESQRAKIRATQRAVLWVAASTTEEVDWPYRDSEFKRFFVDPGASNNRAHGWTFLGRGIEPNMIQGGLRSGDAESGELVVSKEGRLTYSVPLTSLQFEDRAQREIYPFALLEYPVSIVRLLAVLLNEYARDSKPGVMLELGMMRVRGWTLWPYAPNKMGWHEEFFGKTTYEDADDVLTTPPLEFEWDEVTSQPDHCAYRAIRLVYEAFHFTEDKIPNVFDAKTHRLDLG